MKIYLVGPTATGKSTVGRVLAARLDLPFVDADELVAATARMPLDRIFSREGEQGFRRREKEAVRLLTRLKRAVVSLGGGAVLDPEIREWLARSGTVVSLLADPGLLVERLREDPRPGLPHPSEPGFPDRARRAVTARLAAARSLGPAVDVSGLTPDQVVERILTLPGFPPRRPWGGEGLSGGGRWQITVRAGGVSCLVRGEPGAVRQGRLPAPDGVRPSAVLLVSSPLPYLLYGRALASRWREEGLNVHVDLVPDGEEAKVVRWLRYLWQAWAGRRADRDSLVVAVGGGALSDLAGLAAATYLRGLRWVVVPTTLLAQVDASLGGKVAINLPRGKNLVGAYWQPAGIYADVEVLGSLPEAEFRSGLGEVVKCALLEGEDFLSFLEERAHCLLERDPGVVGEVVRRCLALKARVVEGDEREQGPRQLLNLGHTVGHALEREAGWSHGVAVAVGLVAACRLAGADGLAGRVGTLLTRLGLPTTMPVGLAGRVRRRMAWDKKSRRGQLRFVLPRAPGVVQWGVTVPPSEVERVLASLEG